MEGSVGTWDAHLQDSKLPFGPEGLLSLANVGRAVVLGLAKSSPPS